MINLDELISKNEEVTFKCKPAGGAKGEYFAKTKSRLEDPADYEALELIKSNLGGFSQEFIDFFKKQNGARFHEESTAGASSLAIHPVQGWDELTSEMSEWFEMVDEDELEEAEVDWLDECVSFAEIPESGNYFVIALAGVNQGKIIYSDHDGLETEIYANSFNEFLNKFLSSPVEQIDILGCYTRYSDGKTDIQWIPEEIV